MYCDVCTVLESCIWFKLLEPVEYILCTVIDVLPCMYCTQVMYSVSNLRIGRICTMYCDVCTVLESCIRFKLLELVEYVLCTVIDVL